jgi:CTD kinase subunit gamma
MLVTLIEEHMKDRDTKDIALPSPIDGDMPPSQMLPSDGRLPPPRLDKRQVEQRIEEDRERHKKLRENIWAVPNGPTDLTEWEKIWEETSDMGEDDYQMAREEAEEREREWAAFCPHYKMKNWESTNGKTDH